VERTIGSRGEMPGKRESVIIDGDDEKWIFEKS
jgi:hypothetical protein